MLLLPETEISFFDAVADINASSDQRQHESVVAGRLLRLACNVYGLPMPHVVWSRDGVDLPTTSSLRLV